MKYYRSINASCHSTTIRHCLKVLEEIWAFSMFNGDIDTILNPKYYHSVQGFFSYPFHQKYHLCITQNIFISQYTTWCIVMHWCIHSIVPSLWEVMWAKTHYKGPQYIVMHTHLTGLLQSFMNKSTQNSYCNTVS